MCAFVNVFKLLGTCVWTKTPIRDRPGSNLSIDMLHSATDCDQDPSHTV